MNTPTTVQTYTITEIDTTPAVDWYHANTGGETYTELYIDPSRAIVNLHQEMDDNATPSDEWHGITIARRIIGHPNALQAALVLTDSELVERIIAGHDITWNGNNLVGSLTDDADAALAELIDQLENCDPNPMNLYSCDDWFNDQNASDLGVTADSTDDELQALADRLESDARSENVILTGDVCDYLIDIRNNL